MPSLLHDALVQLFRNRPTLAAELLRDALHLGLPTFSDARLYSADLTDIQPAEYRADLVVVLWDTAEGSSAGAPLLGIVVEVQLATNERKRFVWPAYVANLRAKLKCPVCLLVVATDKRVSRWAAKKVHLGGDNYFTPFVIDPYGVPEITDEEQARAYPELAVLSAMAHGDDASIDTSVRAAESVLRTIACLDQDRAQLYKDLVVLSLNDATRRALQMIDAKTFDRRLAFVRRYRSRRLAEGGRIGRATLVIQLLEMRFGALSPDVRRAITAAAIPEIDDTAKRLLTATTLAEALGSQIVRSSTESTHQSPG